MTSVANENDTAAGGPPLEISEARRRTVIRLAAFLVPAVGLFGVVGLAAFRGGSADVGKAAPAWDLERLDQPGRITSAELSGTPYVLNFWASWCVPCREEAPMFAEVVAEGDGIPAFIGVNVLDSKSEARNFIKDFDIRFRNVRDGQGRFRDFRVAGIPETVFVSGDGRIVGRWIGAIDEKSLRRLLAELRDLRPGELLRITGRGKQVGVS